ncbi:MAG TPA: flagellar basal body P-ring formation chaperone FlgA [Candidatus Acidoferrales bacterium]|nr:flagellar basal body P-ring formation chaperone FlgA [Candidatus Acidoferrales bacterium]
MNPVSARRLRPLLLCACLGGGFTFTSRAEEAPPLQLLAVAPVSGDGIFLPQLFSSPRPLPAIRLGDAPGFGKNVILNRAQICDLLAANAPGVGTNFSGPDAIKIFRRARTLGESDILGMLTATLQHDYIKDKGQLELRLSQPWAPLVLPDEPLTLDITDLPTAGVAPGFIVRFTLRTAHETLGNWMANVKASVWREVWVSTVQLKRGDPVSLDLLSRERRDVLSLHEPLADIAAAGDALEISEAVSAGQPLLARMVKPRAVLHRGQRADALVQSGALSVRTQVEMLEDGAPGETVRARNSATHREMTGTVLNDRTILISL